MTRRAKYNAKPTLVDGIRFHSQKEARRYEELKLLEKAGQIRGMVVQLPMVLRAPSAEPREGWEGETTAVGTYRCDFAYWDVRAKRFIFEDVKGFRTPLYRWKKKHVEAQYGITITEV